MIRVIAMKINDDSDLYNALVENGAEELEYLSDEEAVGFERWCG
jgi:hypothetical protein